MPDLFVTLASIAPAGSKVGGRQAERIPGISPSMKDGVLAERSVASTPTPLGVLADSEAISLWRFDESSGTVAANTGGAPATPGGVPHISTVAELSQYYPVVNMLTGGGSVIYGQYVYDPWVGGGRWGRLAGPSSPAGIYIVPVMPPPTSFPQPPWTTGGPGTPLHIVPSPGSTFPFLDDFWLPPFPPTTDRLVVPDSEPPFLSTYGASWPGGGMGILTTGLDTGGAVSSWYAEGSAFGLHSLGTPTSYTSPAPSFVAGGTNPTIGAAKLANGRFFDGSSMWMDAVPLQFIRDQLRGDMTVEGWINLDPAWGSATATYQLGVLSLQTTSAGPHTTTQPQFVIELCRVAPPSDPGQTVQALSFWWLGTDGTVYKKTNVPVTIPTGQWTHFAWRRRNQGGVYTIDYFQNGALAASASGSGGDVVQGTTNKFRLGAIADTGSPTDNFFKGGLDDIRVSRIARSDQEILQTYRRGV